MNERKVMLVKCRGIDAPEHKMPYGDEAKEELTKLVQRKCLVIFVYGEDQYGRSVGDIYCDGIFVQVLYLNLVTRLTFLIAPSKVKTAGHFHESFPMLNQEVMLKKGCAWHYVTYDKRPQLARVSFTNYP